MTPGVARRPGELRQPGAVAVVPGESEAFCCGWGGKDGAGSEGRHHRRLRAVAAARGASAAVLL